MPPKYFADSSSAPADRIVMIPIDSWKLIGLQNDEPIRMFRPDVQYCKHPVGPGILFRDVKWLLFTETRLVEL